MQKKPDIHSQVSFLSEVAQLILLAIIWDSTGNVLPTRAVPLSLGGQGSYWGLLQQVVFMGLNIATQTPAFQSKTRNLLHIHIGGVNCVARLVQCGSKPLAYKILIWQDVARAYGSCFVAPFLLFAYVGISGHPLSTPFFFFFFFFCLWCRSI